MVRTVSKSIFATAVAVLLATGVLSAKFPGSKSDHSGQKPADVELVEASQLPNGSTLEPGKYKVSLLTDSGTPEAGFYQNGNLVAKSPVELVDQPQKSSDTEVHYNDAGPAHVLTQIEVYGWTKALVFSQTGAGGSSAK
ncbi:MAG TPA: hypothetical protein VI455_05395 [Terriglobia bacterium]